MQIQPRVTVTTLGQNTGQITESLMSAEKKSLVCAEKRHHELPVQKKETVRFNITTRLLLTGSVNCHCGEENKQTHWTQ